MCVGKLGRYRIACADCGTLGYANQQSEALDIAEAHSVRFGHEVLISCLDSSSSFAGKTINTKGRVQNK